MEYDSNTSPMSEAQYAPPQLEPDNMYMTQPRNRKWLWIVFAVVFVCAVVVTAIAVLGEGVQRSSLKGNAGVVALYEFFRGQQESQDRLTGNIAKEIGHRLSEEPFEIDADIEMDMDDMGESLFPLSSITVGVDAKYDMKDFGIKFGAMGIEAFGAYVIEDNVVVSLMGKAGSMPIGIKDTDKLKRNMGLDDRIKALLPFLPKDDGIFMELLEAFALSVPDKYTKTGSEEVYSPKEDKNVEMDVITTTLDAKAIKEIAKNFADELDDNKKLSREVQQLLDDFTEFTGMEEVDLAKLLKDMQDSAESEGLDDIQIAWSVYSLQDIYTGVNFEFVSKDMRFSYSLMSEFGGYESFSIIKTDYNGAMMEMTTNTIWRDNKMTLTGEMRSGGIPQLINVAVEYVKENSGGYSVIGEMSVPGTVNIGTFTSENTSYSFKFDADIRAGKDLKTLKEDRDWDGIYKKEWGSMEDVFGGLLPEGFMEYDTGSNL